MIAMIFWSVDMETSNCKCVHSPQQIVQYEVVLVAQTCGTINAMKFNTCLEFVQIPNDKQGTTVIVILVPLIKFLLI